MKKTYTRIKLFAVMLTLAAVNMSAQLGGIYTINSASPTAGANYQTFTAFKNALVAGGISGTVVVNVVAGSGPYNEQVEFPQIVGSSASNTITINGNGCTMSFAGTSGSPWTISLGGMDFMTIDNMNFIGTDGTYAMVGHIWNDADNNTFSNCTFSAPVGGTSSIQCPFSISGSGTSPTSSGNTGDNNVAINCVMNWGYYGIAMYGLTGSPYNVNNQIISCQIKDAYLYSCYNAYQRNLVYRNNIISRPNRSNVTTTYGILLTTGATYASIVEGNRIQNMFGNAPGASVTGYYLYCSSSSAAGFESNFRNNLIQVDRCIGSAYCIYHPGYSYNNFYHNTVSVDNQNDNGSLTVYGTYFYGTFSTFKNNNISITRPGTGTRYGLYYASTITAGMSNGNNVWVTSPSATNYFGYHFSFGTFANLANWQTSTGLDANSFSTDPMYVNPSLYNFMPTSYVMNNGGQALGVTNDINGASRSLATPDPGAWEYFNTPCAGAPAANTVITPTAVQCPNSVVNLFMANSYTTSGNTFQWQSSTVSPVGPFTAVTNGTNSALNATLGANTVWYSAIITCTNGNNSTTAISGSVNVAGTTTNSVPYYEGFEGISAAGRLPNCSWSASNMNGTCFTYTSVQNQNRVPRTGNNFASFYYTPAGNNYFWTNQIWMEAGVNYSIAMYYTTDYYTYPVFQLNLLVGPNQNTVNANVVYTSGGSGSAASPAYKLANAIYTVPTSGYYYVGINGNSNGSTAIYMSWDDLSITVPCSLNPLSLAINANSQNICAGQPVNLTASGATSYLWSNGATTANIIANPLLSTVYSVVGTNAASGCSATASQAINVNPAPPVGIFTQNNAVCLGGSINLTAFGATSYTWNTNATTNAISVSPTSATSYTVIGSNSFGCTAQASQAVVVNPLPAVTIQSSNPNDLACRTDVTTLNYSGTGAVSFQWNSNNGVLMGNPVNVSPSSTTTYTLIGTSAQGCTAQAVYELNVTECVGLNQNTASLNGIQVYPNPSNGVFNIEWKSGAVKSAEVSDISGRVVYTASSELDVMSINLTGFSNGVYFVKVQSNGTSELIRVVKQ
jgi:hypothetical protein